jgi:hypothetical protein
MVCLEELQLFVAPIFLSKRKGYKSFPTQYTIKRSERFVTNQILFNCSKSMFCFAKSIIQFI